MGGNACGEKKGTVHQCAYNKLPLASS